MGRHGSLPIVAPVKPYTELALICMTVNNQQQVLEWILTYFQSQLPTVKDSLFEWVGFLLKVGLGAFTRRNKIL
jgi:hypothetical protein